MTPQRLLLVGSVLVDLVAAVPELPPRGGDIVASAGPVGAGGGFTVLSAAARLGMPAAYGGAHGAGPLGAAVRAALRGEGVELLLPSRAGDDTGWCVALVEPSGERTMITVPGVEAALTADDLAAIEVRDDDAVYVSGYDLAYEVNGPLLGDWLARLRPGPLVVLDPGPLVADIPAGRLDGVLARTDVLTLNAREAGLLGPDRVGGVPAGALTVVRRGAGKATLLVDGDVVASVQPPPVTAVDTTGAGDVHSGALVAGLARGLEPAAALAEACTAAALSVALPGPGRGPTRDQLDAATAATTATPPELIKEISGTEGGRVPDISLINETGFGGAGAGRGEAGGGGPA